MAPKKKQAVDQPVTPAVTEVLEQKKTGRRTPLPPKVQNEVWGRAAGRCQFGGCNKSLFNDDLTGQRHNGATIAHIVAAAANGPRGDAVRSPLLIKDPANLMLTCKAHGSLIDNHDYVDQYTEAVLQEYKQAHEKRVRDATAALDDQKTALMVVQGRIAGKESHIDLNEIRKAIQPRWPGSDDGVTVDLNHLTLGEDWDAYWQEASASINEGVKDITRKVRQSSAHVSVFALAPIPLLTLLGFKLGSRLPADLFQKHRKKPNNPWCWDDGEPGIADEFNLFKPEEVDVTLTDVALVVSVSRQVNSDLVTRSLGIPHARFEIQARSTGTDFLKYRSQLELFATEYRYILKLMGEQFPNVERIHLFQASPAPLAIEAGRNLIEKADAELVVYELNGTKYYPALRLNGGRRSK
ncbi:SAVED domain-containing protein [Deinococcus sp. HMF7604]|uniref:SAVED domain-containing protein n=1 Tax=Deinococcus betulae TaxID=2873312 RepID=UPI001CCA0DC5|nr:SAVED domain-containing protein [Deinococcus betulae]MBZ9749739.1 SAVED domain-containing protein [Deinococcus betulae]